VRGVLFLTDKKGRKIAAMIGIKRYERLLEELEDLQAVIAYDRAKASGEKPIPYEQAVTEIRRKHVQASRRRRHKTPR